MLDEKELEQLSEAVYARMKDKMHMSSVVNLREQLSKQDAMATCRSAVWLTKMEEPELEGEALVKRAVTRCGTIDDGMLAWRDFRYRARKRKTADFSTNVLPWGETFTPRRDCELGDDNNRPHDDVVAISHPEETDPEEIEYEETVNRAEPARWLAQLAEKWDDHELAFIVIMHYAYGATVPAIMAALGYVESELGPKEYQRLRTKMWRLLGPDIERRVAETLAGEEIETLKKYFKGGL